MFRRTKFRALDSLWKNALIIPIFKSTLFLKEKYVLFLCKKLENDESIASHKRPTSVSHLRVRCMVADRVHDGGRSVIIHDDGCAAAPGEGQHGVERPSSARRGGRARPSTGGSQRAKVASASRRPERVSHKPTSTRRVTSTSDLEVKRVRLRSSRTRRCTFAIGYVMASWRAPGFLVVVAKCWRESFDGTMTRVSRDWIAPCWIAHSWCTPRSDTCRLFSVVLRLSWGSEIADQEVRGFRDFKSNIARNYHISDRVRVTWIFDLFPPIERRFHQRNVRRDFARGKKRRKRARDVVWSAARNRSRFAPRFALGNCTIDDCQFRWYQLSISWTRIKSRKGALTERHASTRVSAWPGDLT